MAPALTATTDRLHFAYTDLVNWTLVADDDGVILIDTGFPGSRDDVLASLRQLGFGIDDLRAILLTHAHIDHFGSAIWFAKTLGTPVYCYAAEVGHSKREYLEQASPADIAKHIWQPRWFAWSVAITRKGAMTRDGIPSTQALTEDVGGHQDHAVQFVVVEHVALESSEQHSRHPGLPERAHKGPHRLGVSPATDERP